MDKYNTYTVTEGDLSSFDSEAFLMFIWAQVCETWNESQTAVCVAAGYSLIAASLADMFPSPCWDRPCWQRYWEIISVSPPDIAVWTSLLPSSLYSPSPLLLLPWIQVLFFQFVPFASSYHVLPVTVGGPWQLVWSYYNSHVTGFHL